MIAWSLTIDVPSHVVDDVITIQRGTAGPGWPIPPELKIAYKFCATDGCICNDFFGFPDECALDSANVHTDKIVLAPSVGTPAVFDLVVRELKSGKYSTVKLCNTFQSLNDRCIIASRR
jgi:hypothetical protein